MVIGDINKITTIPVATANLRIRLRDVMPKRRRVI
jgi:hypothetical protein